MFCSIRRSKVKDSVHLSARSKKSSISMGQCSHSLALFFNDFCFFSTDFWIFFHRVPWCFHYVKKRRLLDFTFTFLPILWFLSFLSDHVEVRNFATRIMGLFTGLRFFFASSDCDKVRRMHRFVSSRSSFSMGSSNFDHFPRPFSTGKTFHVFKSINQAKRFSIKRTRLFFQSSFSSFWPSHEAFARRAFFLESF